MGRYSMDKHIVEDWYDMRQFGINELTAEADGVGLRLRCDLNEDGIALLKEFYELDKVKFYEGWNKREEINGKPVVGSVMIARDLFFPLAVYAMLKQYDFVVQFIDKGNTIFRVNEHLEGMTSKEFSQWKDNFLDGQEPVFDYRVYQKTGNAEGGFMNEHFWSGRIH